VVSEPRLIDSRRLCTAAGDHLPHLRSVSRLQEGSALRSVEPGGGAIVRDRGPRAPRALGRGPQATPRARAQEIERSLHRTSYLLVPHPRPQAASRPPGSSVQGERGLQGGIGGSSYGWGTEYSQFACSAVRLSESWTHRETDARSRCRVVGRRTSSHQKLVGGKHIVKVPAPMSYIGSGSSVSLPARLRAQTLRRSVRR
jgi:hypothetical protein